MEAMTNRVKVWMYVWCLIIETNNFSFEVKVILGMESILLGAGWVGGWVLYNLNQLSLS